MKSNPTQEQKKILDNEKKNLIVSASAGSGKTFVVIEYLIKLICEKKIPLSKFLVLTFTKAAASEMKTRLYNAILKQEQTEFLLEQIDEISQSDISTIDAFCEKLIKRNINKLDIDENFSVLDEKVARSLKLMAFDRAYEKLFKENREYFDLIYFAFKKNKEMICDAMLDIQSFFDSNFEGDALADEFIQKNSEFIKEGEDFVCNYIESTFAEQKKTLLSLGQMPDKYENFRQMLLAFCEIKYRDDIIKFFNEINVFNFIAIPRNKMDDEDKKEILNDCKEKLKEIKTLTKSFEGLDSERYKNLKSGDLSIALLSLYKNYAQLYKEIKKSKKGLDFADLEEKAKELLKEQDVLESLQEKYEYIFIDEYQDTNFLQEAIIKPIAEKGNFVAVGDPKQGIYGFRNASMEIMKKDIEDFAKEKDSDALFLTGNFRSDKKVLDFINKIFVKIMTMDGVGIDYQKTSMLDGRAEFKEAQMCPVTIDVIVGEKEDEVPQGVYSVKEDKLTIDEKNKVEVKNIARIVDEALKSKIYDAKIKKYRDAQPSDIAVLFRERSSVMRQTVKHLQEKGFNVVADIKQNLLEDGQIRVLIALVKLTYNFNDDISLVAVMNSWFGEFTLDEILKYKTKDKRFFEVIRESTDEKIVRFRKDIEEFYFDCQVMGLIKALNKLFAQKDFYAHLNSLPFASTKRAHINELFKIIKGGDFEFNGPGLVSYLENNEVGGQSVEQAANAITITTIHATKGLEYPIVILGGCGEKLKKPYKKQYALSKRFGLACDMFDFENAERIKSPRNIATKLLRDKKEFISEIMIFYVALTRAQNHLFITGSQNEKQLKIKDGLFGCQTYLDLIFYAFGKNFTSSLYSQGAIEVESVKFNIIEDVVDIEKVTQRKIKTFENVLPQIAEIKRYIDFEYSGKDNCRHEYKNSVSGVLHLEDNEVLFAQHENGENREKAILRGNAYHEALKLLDFDKIENMKDLLDCQKQLSEQMTEGYFELINFDLLFKNIIIIKNIIGKQKAIKEREFIMQTSLSEAGIANSEENVIVQGVVDLFSMGEKTILIDYKFTSETNEEKLIERYSKQIYLYLLAIEKAFGTKVNEKYLLSLKHAKLIKLIDFKK